eukprot:GFUD01064291.1.p1 GENE.GFUD01064291.1~~GFUD01064291.1.p1  ORF type:complete len:101 (-),score=26.07 GFUD01064291.1:16-318(-)
MSPSHPRTSQTQVAQSVAPKIPVMQDMMSAESQQLFQASSISPSQSKISVIEQYGMGLIFSSLANLGLDSAEATATARARQARTTKSLDMVRMNLRIKLN